MKHFKLVPLFSISVFCLILLVAALQPGRLGNLLTENDSFILFCGSLLLTAAVTFILSKFSQRFFESAPTTIRKPNLWSLLILLVTVFFINLQVPAKAGFALSYPQFQQAINTFSSQKGKNIGLYKIEAVSSNLKRSEGVHFLTFTYWASSVTANYGFAYKPDRQNQKSLFGAYEYEQVFGDWYIFHGTTC
jgi:hypothetical protein